MATLHFRYKATTKPKSKVKTTKTYRDSAVSKIVDIVSTASDDKSKAEKFISTFAKYYTPEEFEDLRKLAEKVGFKNYQIDPLVRSSYKASISWQDALKK